MTEKVIEDVKVLAGRGLTQEQIANYLGISEGFITELKHRHPEFAEAIKEGKAKMISLAAGKLIELVKKGNLSAICFYLKTQARWREVERVAETEETEQKPKAQLPAITLNVNDPVAAAKIYEQFMRGS